jgi:hypothetical protein
MLINWENCFNTYTLQLLLFFIVTNKCTINIIQVYITTVSLCYLYSYLFQHFHVIIREFTTNVLLSYIRFFKLQLLKTRFLKFSVLVHARPAQ